MKLNKLMVMEKISAIAALLLVMAIPCQAVTYHTIRKGESLAMVAKHYYGNASKAILLIAYNEVAEPRHIKPGQRIAIPQITTYRVRKGDTLALIAKRYLNDVNKALGLAKINHIEDPKSLSPGTDVTLPVEIGYTVKKGDSLSTIAQEYYGDINAFGLIALYNGIKNPTNLEPGTRLILPIQDLEIIRTTPSRSSGQPRSLPARNKGGAFLEAGVSDYFMGDYPGAVRKLREALTLGLTGSDNISKAHRFLAYSYVALNKREKARTSFKKALQVDPGLTLDPVYVSPKIIEIFQEVKQERDSRVESQNEDGKR